MKAKKMIGAILLALIMLMTVPMSALAEKPWDETTIEIGDAKTFREFLRKVNEGTDFSGQTIILTADIDLKAEEWEMAGDYIPMLISAEAGSTCFNGTFDGDGHAISGLTKTVVPGDKNNHDLLALFGSVGPDGVIRNLTVKEPKLTGLGAVAGIAAVNRGTINNCCVDGGNLISDEVNLKDGSVFLESTAGVGGICGVNAGTVRNCYVRKITLERGGADMGGICAVNLGCIADCACESCMFLPRLTQYMELTDWQSSGRIGGIAGYCVTPYPEFWPDAPDALIENCTNTASEITGGRATGGICGSLQNATIKNCINDRGNITTTNISTDNGFWMGGICGLALQTDSQRDTTISGCVNYGSVSAGESVGGILGRSEYQPGVGSVVETGKAPLFHNAPADLGVDAANATNRMHVETCLNFGDITGDENLVGGITGKSDAAILACFNAGSVTLSGEAPHEGDLYYLGGVAGISNQSLAQCGSSGDVIFGKTTELENRALVGGILGNAYGSRIDDSYSIGCVMNQGSWPEDMIYLGGAVGVASPDSVADVYFSSDAPTEALVANGYDPDSDPGIPTKSMRNLGAQESMAGLFDGEPFFTAEADYELDGKKYSTSPFIPAAGMDRTTIAVEAGSDKPLLGSSTDTPDESDGGFPAAAMIAILAACLIVFTVVIKKRKNP